MKIPVNRITPLLKQLGLRSTSSETEQSFRVYEQNKQPLNIKEIDTDKILCLYPNLDHACKGYERIEYFNRRRKKFVQLDAASGLGFIRVANRLGKKVQLRDEDGDLVTSFYCDGTFIRDEHGNDHVLNVFFDDDEGKWVYNLAHLSDDSEKPTALLNK